MMQAASGPQDSSSDRSIHEDLERLKFAMQSSGVGIWELRPSDNFVYWDDKCRELFGIARGNEIPYSEAIRFIHPEDREKVDAAVKAALSGQNGGSYDVRYRTIGADDGRLRHVRFSGQAQFDGQGRALRFGGIAQEVTGLVKEVEAQAAASEAKFRSLIEEAPFATALYAGDNLLIDTANEAMIRLWGKTPAVLGMPLAEALPELEGQPFLGILHNILQTGETYHTRASAADLVVDGRLQRFWFNFTYKPLFNEEGRPYAILNMAVDITPEVMARSRQEEAQTALLNAIELAELGTWSLDIATGGILVSGRLLEWCLG